MIDSRKDLQRYQREDLAAHKLSKWRWSDRLRYPIVAYQRRLRYTEWVSNRRNAGRLWRVYRTYCRWRLAATGMKMGLDIPPNVFGPGVSVRYGTIVVHPESRVGARCRIHSGVCIGIKDGKVPRLGDDCYLGPGAKVYGGVVLGNKTKVGPNAVVNKSYPAGGAILVAPRHQAAVPVIRED
jgi:serine O-acetyltransferase